MECPHGEPRGEMYCPFCRKEKGIKFIPPHKRKPVDSNSVRVSARHPDTSQISADRAFLRSGTKKKTIYDLILKSGEYGLCDHELEQITGWSHQTVSASRNNLMNDSWIIDSNQRRNTPQGNPAIAWITRDALNNRVLF